jgi:hypothetical protein
MQGCFVTWLEYPTAEPQPHSLDFFGRRNRPELSPRSASALEAGSSHWLKV